LTPHIRSICDRLASAGYSAYAPDLFHDALHGDYLPYTKEGKERGLMLKNRTGEVELARKVAEVAADLGTNTKVGVIGFCVGGTLAWLAAATPAVACAVGYYSVGIRHHLASRPMGAALMHFGRADPAIKAAEVQALRHAHPAVEVCEYDAGHAFNRDDDAPYQHESAQLAWQRSLVFFSKHLD
jgi:carboxymethylenebutenolidase